MTSSLKSRGNASARKGAGDIKGKGVRSHAQPTNMEGANAIEEWGNVRQRCTASGERGYIRE